MHALTVDEHLLETAKARAVAEREMTVSAEQLYATLEDGPAWSKWTGVIREVTWTSPKPFAIGTTRTLKLAGGVTLDEVFWAWEPNRRMGFSVTAEHRLVERVDRGLRNHAPIVRALQAALGGRGVVSRHARQN